MDRIRLKKNRLDLVYHRRSQHQNAVLILATTGLLTFVGTFLWNEGDKTAGFLITLFIFTVSALWYKKIDKDLHAISEEIEHLR